MNQNLKQNLVLRCLALALLGGLLGSCNNILSSLKDTTDASLYFQAQEQVDSLQWTAALTSISDMSTSYQSTRAVLDLKASAYAGRCGLRYVQLISQLSSIGTTRLFLFLLEKFDGATATSIADCESAVAVLQQVSSTVSGLSEDEALFLVFLSFAKIGVILAADADPAATGSPSASFNACSTSSMSDADAGNIGTALSDALAALTSVASLSSVGSSQLSSLSTVCTTLAADAPTYNFCGITNTSDLTATELLGIRSLVQENQLIGLGTCNGNLGTCLCP
jgi:hypothetical protein